MTKSCIQNCLKDNAPCQQDACRHHIDYEEDMNCSIISADAHGPMTLEDVAARVGLSLVRIKQIEHAALVKLSKRVDPDMYYE
jgi:hypothetical protein